ncbi:MAG TPA: TonB family protein [Polyangiaceae bacterium]|nr:TonB family protein [Polyangiaceae bacterium]
MKRGLLPWTIAASLLLHGLAFASLSAAPPSVPERHTKTQLRFDVVEQAKPKPVEELPQPPKPEPPKPKARAAEPKPVPKPEEAPPPAPAPGMTTPAGVTLAGDGTGNAFSMPLGSGGALEPQRARAPAPVNVPAPVAPAPTPVPEGPRVVAVGDLSARPAPPGSLGAALERNYPAEARRQGLSGSAKVRARIDPDGVVRRVSLVEESGAGFGAACSRTLNGSRWAAPRDKAGHSVATEIRYTCRFVVNP